jgi:hypothetical protein
LRAGFFGGGVGGDTFSTGSGGGGCEHKYNTFSFNP